MLNINGEELDEEMARSSLKTFKPVQRCTISDDDYLPNRVRHDKPKCIG